MNIKREDLNLLVVFATVAETRSVTMAADRLSLSQPAVSHAIGRLRRMMNDPLFVRGRGGFTLTPRAQSLVIPISDILVKARRLFEVEAFDPATSTQTFRIGSSDYSTATIFPGLIRHLRSHARFVRAVLHTPSEMQFSKLEAGELDIAFWGETRPSAPFRSVELFRERFIGVVHRSHPLADAARSGQLTLDDYLAHLHLHTNFQGVTKSIVDLALQKLNVQRNILLVTPSFASNLAMLVDTDLIMTMPSRLAGVFIDAFDLIEFDLPFIIDDYSYFLIWHQRTDEDPAMVWLRRVIMEVSLDFYG